MEASSGTNASLLDISIITLSYLTYYTYKSAKDILDKQKKTEPSYHSSIVCFLLN